MTKKTDEDKRLREIQNHLDFSYISHDEEDDLRDVWNNAKNMDGRYVKKQR